MASQGTGYDLSASTFSPDGKVFQVEYAARCADSAGTALGLRCKDGIVLAVEKLVTSKLLVPGSNRRIFACDRHLALATAGLTADGKHLAGRARDEAANFKDTYRYPSSVKALADRLGLYMHAYTLYSSVRPFGVSAILAGVDQDGPALYMLETSGVFWGYRGTAIGKGRQLARTEIEKLDLENLTCEEAIQHAANIIYKVHDDAKDKDFELELSWICPQSNNVIQPVPKDLVAQVSSRAKAALDDEMED
ncbi:putative proteasome subunit alpha type-7 [Tilletia horrida]|uniref:Proteasome subunit alpha type-7 n=1 Tax=Tilletia horrida TaxID=155126 RepID=A0AAN6JHX0_9BASI|nr:putative proteasome subunit alpha type-7 [Tilletia horrida]KAK0522003.1 putative proteasome subunit alpha type-7 [Tilletia horrida]KAK0527691.1 putative proteasome subunit alpha type-7 [Tilletia horrida]KAK0566906.1 putative proteasome subunit alpha type-7 [Tilletia horrida]